MTVCCTQKGISTLIASAIYSCLGSLQKQGAGIEKYSVCISQVVGQHAFQICHIIMQLHVFLNMCY
jgi:hypothetical protein